FSHEETSENALVLSGNVTQVSYPGGQWRHLVDLEGQIAVVDAPTAFEPGTSVCVRIPGKFLFVFPAAGGCNGNLTRKGPLQTAIDRTREVHMKRLIVGTTLAFSVLALASAQADELNVITAGAQNMVDYINDYLGPLFEQEK